MRTKTEEKRGVSKKMDGALENEFNHLLNSISRKVQHLSASGSLSSPSTQAKKGRREDCSCIQRYTL